MGQTATSTFRSPAHADSPSVLSAAAPADDNNIVNVASQLNSAPPPRQSFLRNAAIDRVGIGYALIDNCSFQAACAAIISHAKARSQPVHVTTANAQHIVLLDNDRRLREIYNHAELVVADGISLLFAARLFGRCLQERIAGVDMFQSLCGLAAENNLHVFLLGGRPNSAELTAAALKQRSPSLKVSIYCPPFDFEKTGPGLRATEETVRAAKPDILFVALGAPKQEYWIHEHALQFSVPVCIGVGGSFEMVANVIRRAPLWIQKCGFEWLYRLHLEPRRLWRRYLIGNIKFGIILSRQCIRRLFLAAFFSLLDKGRFAAELYEPGLQDKTALFASRGR